MAEGEVNFMQVAHKRDLAQQISAVLTKWYREHPGAAPVSITVGAGEISIEDIPTSCRLKL